MLTLLLTVSSTFAATLDVCETGCTYSTIQGAVDASVSGDEIVVQDDATYSGFSMQGKVDLTLRSLPNVRPTIGDSVVSLPAQGAVGLIENSTGIEIEGFRVVGDSRRGFTVGSSSVAFDDMVIRDSNVTFSGGGMELVASTVTISNSVFEDNTTSMTGFGGHIIAFSETSITTVDTNFVGGISEQGGAIWISGGSLTMTGGFIAGNETLTGGTNIGGGIRALNAAVSLTSVGTLENVADDGGGDVHAVGGTLTIDDCDLDGGVASAGGAVYLVASNANIIDSEMYGSSVSGLGGVVYSSTSLLTISDSGLSDGTAAEGGCVALEGTTATFTNVNVDDCIAISVDDDGADEGRRGTTGNGGLISSSGSNLTIVGGGYTGGAADFDGGGVFANSGRVDVSDAEWLSSEAGRNGGGICLVQSAASDISDSEFAGHTADLGGALFLTGTGTVAVNETEFLANEAVDKGGALYVRRLESLTLTDADVVGNTADTGGGLYMGTSGVFESTRTHWCDNVSAGFGGAVLVQGDSSSILFTSDEWVQNAATRGGALALQAVEGDVRVVNNTFFANDSPNGAAVSAQNSSPLLDSCIFADSISGPAVRGYGTASPTLVYNDWWNNVDGDVGGTLSPTDLDATNVFSDPGFQDAVGDSQCNDNLWVVVDRATIDAGSPDRLDPDDTTPSAELPSDIGAFGGPDADPDAWLDEDGDGYPVMWDCDDDEPTTYDGAVELCDGLDNDCDGLIDNDAIGGITYYVDNDEDDYGDRDSAETTCGEIPVDAVTVGGDCDDENGDINPGADEVCDEIDNDCNDSIDDNAEDATDYYFDDDDDEFGNLQDVIRTCGDPLDGYVILGDDCDDNDATVYPFAPELCDGISNDCDDEIDEDPEDGRSFFVDGDGDGFGGSQPVVLCEEPANVAENGDDCDDAAADINPNADEACNGLDDNCDEVVDPPGSLGEFLVYPDADGDEFGADGEGVLSCVQGDGQVLVDGDCDDSEVTVFEGADELCDGLDNDCDTEIDNDVVGLATWYADSDSDDYGNPEDSLESCSQPPGYVSNAADCDDSNRLVSPDGEEVCNGVDDDCDETIDIGASDAVVVFPDADEDGQGEAGSDGEATCSPGENPVVTATDCDDTNETVFVGADELCDGLDNDCNERVDDGVEFQQWYEDNDEDGFGGEASGAPDCAPPVEGAVTTFGDCDDTDDTVFPGADEIPQDGIDQDCDGLDELPDPDSTRDFEPGEDPDTGVALANGCDCDASAAPNPAWALAFLGLLLVRRRRAA